MPRLVALALVALVAAGCDDGGAPDAGGSDAGRASDAGGSGDDAGTGDAGDGLADAGDGPADAGDTADAGVSGTAGCGAAAPLAEGEHTFELESRERRFIVRLPDGYAGDRPWPLVLALHPNGGDIGYWDRTEGPRNVREVLRDEAVLVVAEAIGGDWRDYSLESDEWPARLEEELRYFDEVIAQARAGLCLDEGAFFAMGFSGGGSFSGVLGCRRTDLRAIAAGGAVRYFDAADCVGTPAAWITIGTEELNDSRAAFRDYFRDRAGCVETSADTEPDPCVAYDGCAADTPVHYCEHPGDHVWPAFGTQAFWAFFESLR